MRILMQILAALGILVGATSAKATVVIVGANLVVPGTTITTTCVVAIHTCTASEPQPSWLPFSWMSAEDTDVLALGPASYTPILGHNLQEYFTISLAGFDPWGNPIITGSLLAYGFAGCDMITPQTQTCTYQDSTYAGTFQLTQISPAAVPEPSTWAMLLVGLGAMGLQLRRRRASCSALRSPHRSGEHPL